MIVVTFPVDLQTAVMAVVGDVEAKDVSVTIKVRGDVGEGIIAKLKEIGAAVIHPIKASS